MKRLQIRIEEELDAELQRMASREGTSKAALVRSLLRMHVRPLPPIEEDPLWRLVGSIDWELPKNRDGSEPTIDEVVYEWPSSIPPSGSHSNTTATRTRRKRKR